MTRNSAGNGRADVWIMSGLTLLAILTRLPGLGAWDFLVDEFATFYYAEDRMFGIRNPAYYALTYWFAHMLGAGELSARLPAAIFGIAAVPTVYLTWRTVIGRHGAFIAAVLVLISSWHLWYSQFARFYSAVFFFGSLAFYLYWRALKEDDLRKLSLALVANGLGILFHLTSVVVAGTFAVYLLLTLAVNRLRGDRYSRRVALVTLAVYALGGLIIVPFGLQVLSNWEGMGQHWGYGPASLMLQLVKYIQLPIAAAALLGILVLIADRRDAGVYLLSCTAIPALALFVLGAFTVVRPDYYFYALPLVFVGAGYLCGKLVRDGTVGVAGSYALAVVLLVSAVPEFASHYTGHRSLDVRTAIAYIDRRLAPGDQVMPMVSGVPHYARAGFPLAFRPGSPFDGSLDWQVIMDSAAADAGRLWVVVPAGRLSYARGFSDWLGENAQLVWRAYESRYDYTVRGLEIYRTTGPADEREGPRPSPTAATPLEPRFER